MANRNITRRGGIGRPGTALRQAGGGRPRFFKSRNKKKKVEPYSGPESAHNQDGSPNPDFVKWADRPENQGKPGAKGGPPMVAPAVAAGLVEPPGPPPSDALFPKDNTKAKKAVRKRLMRGGFNKRG
jgi:hypothetical protein